MAMNLRLANNKHLLQLFKETYDQMTSKPSLMHRPLKAKNAYPPSPKKPSNAEATLPQIVEAPAKRLMPTSEAYSLSLAVASLDEDTSFESDFLQHLSSENSSQLQQFQKRADSGKNHKRHGTINEGRFQTVEISPERGNYQSLPPIKLTMK